MYKKDYYFDSYNNDPPSLFVIILMLVGLFLLLCTVTSCELSINRSSHNMTLIEDDYCYDNDGQIQWTSYKGKPIWYVWY